jgi:ketosteroid isomerase-like protein
VLAVPAPLPRLAFAVLVRRLVPGSELRRRLLKHLVARAFDAHSRGEHEFGLRFYEDELELHVRGGVAQALGLAETYRGHQGVRQIWDDYRRDMADFRAEPEEIIDLGDRYALRVTLVGTGRSSGATTRHTEGFIVYFSRRGLIGRQEIYWRWEDALAELHGRDPVALER